MDKERVKTFADKVYADMAGAMAMGMASIGVKTGLFRAMRGKGRFAAEELAQATGLQPRYVEEWLKGMTAAGYLDYDPAAQTFALPDEHAYLVASEGTDHFMGGLFCFAPVLLGAEPKVVEAFRHGGGVRFADYGADCVSALDMINAGQYAQRLGSYWLAQLPGVAEKLERGGRVLDFGCGVGRVAIAIAKAFPGCEIVGVDIDAESIRRAQAQAREEGLADRIAFAACPVAELDRGAGFDLIAACDCLHDFSAPLRTLAQLRALLKPDGTLFVVEPKSADRLEDNINPMGAAFYGFSLFHCMPQSLAEGGPGLGTCLGPARTQALLREAGFSRVSRPDIKSQTHLFYAAQP